MNVTDDQALRTGACASTADGDDDTVAALRRSRLCDGLAREELEQVAAKVRPVGCPAGQAVCRAGQPGDSMFIVTGGRMKVTAADHGGENRVLAYLSRGDHFGEIALLDAGKRTANVTAETDSEVLVLEREAFQQLCDELPKVAKNLLRTLGLRFGDTLRGQCHASVKRVVGLVQSSRRAAGLLPLLARQLAQRGEEVFVFGHRPSGETQTRTAALPTEDGECLRPADLQRYVDRLSESADRVLVEIESPMEPTRLSAVLGVCDDILWLVDPSEEKSLRSVWTQVRQQSPSVAARSQIVWILRPNEQVAPRWHLDWDSEHRSFKLPLPDGPGDLTRLERQGLDRIVRHLRGPCIGLALGGGGARGMAHFGVERALDRAGITFDLISGTSCGAMVAIGYASGYEPDYGAHQFGDTLTPPRWMHMLPGGDRWYLPMMFRTGMWDRMLRPYFHDWTLEQLLTPCSVVAVDLITGRQVVRDKGDAVAALLESINLPVISRPICRDGMVLVDGSVLNNLPADVLAGKGCDFIVGVNVSAKLSQQFAGNHPGMPPEKMKSGGMLETLLRIFEIHDHELNAVRGRSVDFLIEPDTARFPIQDFTRAQELADAGEAAAEAAIPHLKTMLAALERPQRR